MAADDEDADNEADGGSMAAPSPGSAVVARRASEDERLAETLVLPLPLPLALPPPTLF